MATKEEVLQYIRTLAEHEFVSREELVAAFDSGSGIKTGVAQAEKLDVAKILYYIGGAIVFLGISFFVLLNWGELGPETKILATLGFGMVAYLVGLLFSREKKTEAMSSSFFFISILTILAGFFVVFSSAGFDLDGYGIGSLISGIMLGICLLSFFLLRKNIFILFAVLFGTWLFFSLTSLMIGDSSFFDRPKFYKYRILVAGVAYGLLGYAFSKRRNASISGFLYSFGILGFLGAALALGGWEPNQSPFWEFIFPILVFGVLLFSVRIKSKAFLIFGTIFLIAFINKITAEYFLEGLGWPLALVLAGFTVISIGFASVSLKKKYLSA